MTDELDARPILLGEAPSRGGDKYHRFPLSGPPARVLCQLAGIPPDEEGSTYGRWTWALYDRFECLNLFERYAQAEPWSIPRARVAAGALMPDLAGRVVVLLGSRVIAAVWGAMRLAGWELSGLAPRFHDVLYGVDDDQPAALLAVMHPSGLNRALNDPAERDRCGATLRRALELAGSPVQRT